MKKIILFLSLIIIFVSGCSTSLSLSSKDIVIKAQENMQEINNFTTKVSIDMKGVTDGVETSYSMYIDGKIDLISKNTALETTMMMDNTVVIINSYIEEKDDKLITYTKIPIFGGWMKKEQLVSEKTNSYNFDTLVLKMLDDGLEYKKVDSDLNDSDKYEVTVPNEILNEFMIENADILEIEDSVDELAKEGNTIIYIYIDKNDYISKVVIDMASLIEKALENEPDSIAKALFTIEFSEINNSPVTIPSEVIAAANEDER